MKDRIEIENPAPFTCHACGVEGVAGFDRQGDPVLAHKEPFCAAFVALESDTSFVEYLRTCRNKMQTERGIS